MARALSVAELLSRRRRVMEFEGEWLSMMGQPEMSGSWIVWGASGSGKTRFALRLCKYLTQFGRVAYNSLEEGDSESLARAFDEVGMTEVAKRIILLDGEPIKELSERLLKRKSPDIIVVDSLQYTGMTYTDYRKLKAAHRNKLFIFISHADGKEPSGKVAKSVRYDSFIKIRTEGYRAFPVSRYGGGEPYIIWEEEANKYYRNNNE